MTWTFRSATKLWLVQVVCLSSGGGGVSRSFSSSSSALALTTERFSVAPMMGHTNRHYHTFFRFISQQAPLYTEMIPAESIVNLYKKNFIIESNEPLQELLGIYAINQEDCFGPIILQLGGKDPDTLALACEIGVRMGYKGINLNCGCPSNAVSGRAGGCALMRTPYHVAKCVEQMSEAIARVSPEVELSVKHRLGVRDAATYDAQHDKQQNDNEAYEECENFIQIITRNSNVTKLQVHARLGLLGEFQPERTETLWTPSSSESDSSIASSSESSSSNGKKVDHVREQRKAKKRARIATIQNRSVPPLRPKVVNELAANMPHLHFVTNGGIKSLTDVHNRVNDDTKVMGAMVGRSVINHPCSFSHVDHDLWGKELPEWTRQDVIRTYIQYCIEEEEICQQKVATSNNQRHQSQSSVVETLRKRLVAVPFSLFAGEQGNNAYQRSIRKLISRPGRHTAATILQGAITHIPPDVLSKPITDFSPLDNIESYSEYIQRSGPLQRAIM